MIPVDPFQLGIFCDSTPAHLVHPSIVSAFCLPLSICSWSCHPFILIPHWTHCLCIQRHSGVPVLACLKFISMQKLCHRWWQVGTEPTYLWESFISNLTNRWSSSTRSIWAKWSLECLYRPVFLYLYPSVTSSNRFNFLVNVGNGECEVSNLPNPLVNYFRGFILFYIIFINSDIKRLVLEFTVT